MIDNIRLLGAEEVAAAGRNICAAADQMSRAVADVGHWTALLVRVLEEHARRIEAAMTEPTPRRVIVSERIQEPGTRKWIDHEKGPALFLRWGSEFEEFQDGVGNLTVAIVQFPDGRVETVLPSLISFEVTA